MLPATDKTTPTREAIVEEEKTVKSVTQTIKEKTEDPELMKKGKILALKEVMIK